MTGGTVREILRDMAMMFDLFRAADAVFLSH